MVFHAKAMQWGKDIGLKWPIIQAPMAGGITTPNLVAAVSNSGGLGSLGAGYMTPSQIEQAIHEIRTLTTNPFAVNLFIPEPHTGTEETIKAAQAAICESCPELEFDINEVAPPYVPSFEQQMEVVLQERVGYFSFTFGIPDSKWLDRLRERDVYIMGTATTTTEAQLLADKKVDAIIAQGKEAGGHRGSFLQNGEQDLLELSAFITLLAKSLTTPIVAAGGIMNGERIGSMLSLGASGVQLGTAFLTCPESGAHPMYKKLLLAQTADNTVLTRAFSGKRARGLKNKFIERMAATGITIADYPIQNALTRPMRTAANKDNNTDFMSLWAGQSAHSCRELPAKELVQILMEEAHI